MKKTMPLKKFALYVALPMLPIIIFWFIPMLVTLLISFTNWDYISPTYDVVGIGNYVDLFENESFYQALRTTAVFGLGTVVPTLAIGFFLALFLIRQTKAASIFRGMLFSPWITPMVAMSIVWSWMFRADVGLINRLLGMIGVAGPNWLQDSSVAIYAIIIVTVWKNSGWAMLFYSDAFSKIPNALNEVCSLEGASFLDRLKNLYIPLSKKTSVFLFVITLIDSIQAYDQINVLTQGGPSGSTRTLLYLFNYEAFDKFNMGTASSVAVVIVVLTALLALAMKFLTRKAA